MYNETLQRNGRQKPHCSSCFMLMLSAMAVGLCMGWGAGLEEERAAPLAQYDSSNPVLHTSCFQSVPAPTPETLLFWIRTEIWVQLHHLGHTAAHRLLCAVPATRGGGLVPLLQPCRTYPCCHCHFPHLLKDSILHHLCSPHTNSYRCTQHTLGNLREH